MDILYTYWKKPGEWPTARRTLRLPDAASGIISVVLENQRYLEIARVCGAVVRTSDGHVHEDAGSLTDALVAFHEGLRRAEFRERLGQFAESKPKPNAIQLALFAHGLAEGLGIDLADMSGEQETAAAAE